LVASRATTSGRWIGPPPTALAALLVAAALATACTEHGDDAGDAVTAALERLRRVESSRRAATDFRLAGSEDDALGPDPIALAPLPGAALVVGALRGASAVVLLDVDGRELDRTAAPRGASSLAVDRDGEIFVSGDLAADIARYRVRDGRLERRGTLPLGGARAVRALAYGREGVLYAVEEHDHRLLTLALDDGGAIRDASEPPIGLGPIAVMRAGGWLVVDCLLSHEVIALPVDTHGLPRRADAVRIRHDGPIWAVDGVEADADLWLAMGGVEDHPLDRRQGSFGYIDSFAWVYRIGGTPRTATRLATVNVGALGVVTPKLVRLAVDPGVVDLEVTGYATPLAAHLRWTDPRPNRKAVWPRPEIETRVLVPGIAAGVPLAGGVRLLADPLLDAWVVDDGRTARVAAVVAASGAQRRDVEARLGEALFFTTLMAPWNRTRGSLSRFTCETCHFEGWVDGRIHDTGREGDVHVTTRPLRGLFNDLPYFSRALDPDLTTMVHNEFRVAGRRSRHDPWFALEPSAVPWLASLDVGTGPIGGEDLRRALMAFFMTFAHRPNPSVLERPRWSTVEREGAALFRDHCETCHEARLVANRADTRLAFDQWEPLVMSAAGPVLWARATYEQTGVVPYVHPSGARVPSLRRLYKKRPYFTNGSAADLDDVLRRARVVDGSFRHAADSAAPLLDAPSRAALRAFLDLL
jgi:hypothetical protein